MQNQIDAILNIAVEIYQKESLLERLHSGKRLKIKFGADPSRPDLHLGHTVVLRQLRRLQEMGHEIIFVIGDFTGMIGDPTGKSVARPKLTLEETRQSGQTYFEQVSKVMDAKKTTICYNSQWLGAMQFADVIELSSKYTVARLLVREDFHQRFTQNQPIHLHEMLYPLVQGYDSVALQSDIEVGGTDQTFNLLVGRALQRDYGQQAQEVITFPLLVGLDGKEKMSKSLGNYIGISEAPEVMYEKAMRIPDALLSDYFRLTTDIPFANAKALCSADIVQAHAVYAREIVTMYHSEQAAQHAMQRYQSIAAKQLPTQMATLQLPAAMLQNGAVDIIALVRHAGFAPSNSQARRLIEGGGIKLDGEPIRNPLEQVAIQNGTVLSRGKNQMARLVLAQ